MDEANQNNPALQTAPNPAAPSGASTSSGPTPPTQPENSVPPQSGNPSVQKVPLFKRPLLLIGGVLLIILIPLFTLMIFNTQKKDNEALPKPTEPVTVEKKPSEMPDVIKLAPATLVFGVRSGKNSILKTYDLATEKTSDLVYLPSNIKKVNIFSPESVIYIDQIDNKQLGTQIILYDIKKKGLIKSIHADEGYGIEDYILSPNKKYITVWEVSYAPNKSDLQMARSRVYAVDLLRPHIKNLLYDETALPNSLIHYPRAILNSGKVFTDKLLPSAANDQNNDSDWAHGMSAVEFNGTNKQDIDQMQNGTYITSPMFSPDGKHVLFVGFDGSVEEGAALKNGVRHATLNPNTVELFNLETYKRQKFDLPGTNSYKAAYWDSMTGNAVIDIASPSEKEVVESYSYDLILKSLKKIDIPKSDNKKINLLSLLPNNRVIISKQTDLATVQAKLGENYVPLLAEINIIDLQVPEDAVLAVKEPILHYITTLPLNYFKIN